MKRRLAFGVAALVPLAALLVVVGRWEGDRHTNEELRGMQKVLAAIGPLDNPSLAMYRFHVGFGFDCLLYRRGVNRFALEVCIDRQDRVVETIDRRAGGDPVIASLREHPDSSTIRVDEPLVQELLRRLGAPTE